MGRAMLIICAGTLIAMGIIQLSTSRQGLMITQQTVNYADYVMAKNSAHTAIQMAMQEINQDEDWPHTHNVSNPWLVTINDRQIELHTSIIEGDDFWEPDSLWLVSNADHLGQSVEVISLYLKEPFSTLVPEFLGGITLPSGFGNFNVDGAAHSISGMAPEGSECEDKPAIVTHDEEAHDQLPDDLNANGNPPTAFQEDLSYEPTDELIERLYSSGNATTIDGNYNSTLGSASDPGVFFIEDGVNLTGNQSEGFGILVIRSGGIMEYDGELDVSGNFEWNGLVIFENAFAFDGRGTPTINGSVLIGNTEEYDGDPIDIDLGGNIHIQYDCQAENYARMAAAMAVEQNKYSRVVTSEHLNISDPM